MSLYTMDQILNMAINLASSLSSLAEYFRDNNDSAEKAIEDNNIVLAKDGDDIVMYEKVECDGADIYQINNRKIEDDTV